jgi:hypothetical protein
VNANRFGLTTSIYTQDLVLVENMAEHVFFIFNKSNIKQKIKKLKLDVGTVYMN